MNPVTPLHPVPPTSIDLTGLVAVVAPDGTVHLEATVGGELTACGKTTGIDVTIVDADAFTCRDCADALSFAAKADGRPDDLRVAAGALLIAADRLDPTGGTLSPEETD